MTALKSVPTRWMWCWTWHQIRWDVTIELYWSVVWPIGSYASLCGVIISINFTLSFISFKYWLWHPGRSTSKQGDKVTLRGDLQAGVSDWLLLPAVTPGLVSGISQLYSTFRLIGTYAQLYYHSASLQFSVGVCAIEIITADLHCWKIVTMLIMIDTFKNNALTFDYEYRPMLLQPAYIWFELIIC